VPKWKERFGVVDHTEILGGIMNRKVFMAFGFVLLLGCAPRLYYTQIGIPKPSVLTFSVSELAPRLISARGPYKDFDFIVQKIGRDGTETLYTYRIDSVGELTGVSFQTANVDSNNWTFMIQRPQVKIEDLFAKDELKVSSLSDVERTVHEVVSGPLKGSCASQWLNGFFNSGDRAILIEGELSSSECSPN
jgi:hypothetical protein